VPPDVEPEYYYYDLFKPSKVSPFHVVFGLKGVLARQGKSFKPCTLILVEWWRNSLQILMLFPNQSYKNSCRGVFNNL
jgi:hypothetical protein